MKKLILLFSAVMVMSCTKAQNPGDISPVTVGDYSVYILSEGQREGNPGILIGASPEMIAKAIPTGSYPSATNMVLVRTPDKNILIDTGVGRLLLEHLESLGINADEIDAILITHTHGDHTGGLLKDGQNLFPNAKLYLSQPEYDYWANSTNQQARSVLEAYKNQLVLFTPNELTDITTPLLAGVFAIETYGHTPGHTVFLIQSGNDQLVVWGDLTHAMAIQMPYPQVAVTYDTNPEEAVRSREAILKYVSENKIPVAGMHIASPGVGLLQPDDENGYIFTPITINN
jgi:glyoxylase-like metal-dependent hydrolase (beta-lactamase superfamily II)